MMGTLAVEFLKKMGKHLPIKKKYDYKVLSSFYPLYKFYQLLHNSGTFEIRNECSKYMVLSDKFEGECFVG